MVNWRFDRLSFRGLEDLGKGGLRMFPAYAMIWNISSFTELQIRTIFFTVSLLKKRIESFASPPMVVGTCSIIVLSVAHRV